MNNNIKNIYQHILDKPLTHTEVTLISAGLTLRQSYDCLMEMIDDGLIERTEDLKFKAK